MIRFNAIIEKFSKQGEKTGWTYVLIPAALAAKLNPGKKTSFRVKGKLDQHSIQGIALMPMGEGDYILPLKAAIRKAIHKKQGDTLSLQLELDSAKIAVPEDLVVCLEDEPKAKTFFYDKLPGSHRNYFIKWIDSAKTEATRSKRIAMTIDALCRGWHYGQMIRASQGKPLE